MAWGLIVFLVGIAYGYMTPGREDKMHLFWNGLLIGAVTAFVFAVLGTLSGYDALGFGGGLGLFITIVALTLLFVVGAWIGDFLEWQPRKASR
jgi:hypothetical protein